MVDVIYAGTAQLSNNWMDGVVLDDQLWFQSLRVNRLWEEHLLPQIASMTVEERMLHRLINSGVMDASEGDRPNDSATRAMRYSAALADHLSSMLRTERTRVCAQKSRFS